MAILRMINMKFSGHHGVSDEEKTGGGDYEIDCEIETDISRCGASDDINDAVDYSEIYDIISEHMEKRSYNLMETLAVNLKNEIKGKFDSVSLVLRVRKMAPPVGGNMDCFEVEISD